MACGCGSKRNPPPAGSRLAQYSPSPGPNGVYEVSTHEGCFTPYNGARRMESLYIVGHNTDGQRIFSQWESKDALAYRKSSGLTLFRVHSTQLCSALVSEFFGE